MNYLGVLGGLDLHGKERSVRTTHLASGLSANQNAITIVDQPTDWKAGELFVIEIMKYKLRFYVFDSIVHTLIQGWHQGRAREDCAPHTELLPPARNNMNLTCVNRFWATSVGRWAIFSAMPL